MQKSICHLDEWGLTVTQFNQCLNAAVLECGLEFVLTIPLSNLIYRTRIGTRIYLHHKHDIIITSLNPNQGCLPDLILTYLFAILNALVTILLSSAILLFIHDAKRYVIHFR